MEPQGGEFVQIVNIHGNHWITPSNVGCKPGHINVYDSLHMGLSKEAKELLPIFCSTKRIPSSSTIYCDIQWQSGGNDCGLFSIAFATAICAGSSPVSKMYDQSKMWQHLVQCFEGGVLTQFPGRSCKRVIKGPARRSYRFTAFAGFPTKEKMVQCEKCNKWFHPDCAKIQKKYLSHYYCKLC